MKISIHLRIILLASLSINQIQASESPLLLIKIPTRSRPTQFFAMLNLYYAKLSGKNRYHFLISCDSDDAAMNNPKAIKQLQSYKHLTFNFSKNRSKVQAYNADMKLAPRDWAIVLVTSDDMEPIKAGYDEIIIEKMKAGFPRFDGVLNFNDGHGHGLNTLPIIGRRFYRKFGYIYNPSYISLFCDNELMDISQMLHKELKCPEVIIRHNHPAWNTASWDSLYAKNESFANHDRQVYSIRKANNFYLHLLKKGRMIKKRSGQV